MAFYSPSIESVASGGGIGGVPSDSVWSDNGWVPNNLMSSGCTLTLPP